MVRFAAGVQMRDEVGSRRKDGQEGVEGSELSVGFLARGFGELRGKGVFQSANGQRHVESRLIAKLPSGGGWRLRCGAAFPFCGMQSPRDIPGNGRSRCAFFFLSDSDEAKKVNTSKSRGDSRDMSSASANRAYRKARSRMRRSLARCPHVLARFTFFARPRMRTEKLIDFGRFPVISRGLCIPQNGKAGPAPEPPSASARELRDEPRFDVPLPHLRFGRHPCRAILRTRGPGILRQFAALHSLLSVFSGGFRPRRASARPPRSEPWNTFS